MSDERRTIGAAMREVDQAYRAFPVPDGAYERLVSRVEAATSPAARSWRGPLLLATGAVSLAVLGLLVWPLLTRPDQAGGFEVSEASPDLAWRLLPDDVLEIQAGHGTLTVPDQAASLRVERGTRLRKAPRSIELRGGRLSVTVRPRTAAEPLAIQVSHGRIEVMGTEFDLEQGAVGGMVHVRQGRVRFVSTDGQQLEVSPGQRLSWPLPPVAATAPPLTPRPVIGSTPDTGATAHSGIKLRVNLPRSRAPVARVDTAALLTELETLRVRREYRAMVARLEQVIPLITDTGLREQLSFERCDVLANRLRDRAAACQCIAESSTLSFTRSYHERIKAIRAQLTCPE